MAFKVGDLTGSLNSLGIANNHDYSVMIIPPGVSSLISNNSSTISSVANDIVNGNFSNALSSLENNIALPSVSQGLLMAYSAMLKDDMWLRCDAVELPGRFFTTEKLQTHGAERKIPYAPTYYNLTLSFIADEHRLIRRFFDMWQNVISNPRTNYMAYYNDIIGSILITQHTGTGNKKTLEDAITTGILVEEVFPMNVLAQQLSYGDTDSYQKVQVTFTYQQWSDPSAYILPGNVPTTK